VGRFWPTLFAGIATLAGGGACRADEYYVLSQAHSTINFNVDVASVAVISGVFTKFRGDLVYCPAHPERDRVAIVLDSNSIKTRSADLDNVIKGPHFFDAQHFPSIRFTSTKLTKLGADRAELAGTLTLLRAARPVSFLIQFRGADRDIGTGLRRLDFAGLGIIRRSEFGMDFLEPVVRDEVQLRIDAQAIEASNADDTCALPSK
jgi:polyisoprenoid-binding protein YceI